MLNKSTVDQLTYYLKKYSGRFEKTYGRRPIFCLSFNGKLRTVDKTAPYWKKTLDEFTEIVSPYADIRIVGCTDLLPSYVSESNKSNIYNGREQEFSKHAANITEEKRLAIAKQHIPFDYLYVQSEKEASDSEFDDQHILRRQHRQFKKFVESYDNFDFDISFRARFDMILHSNVFDPSGVFYLVSNFINALQYKFFAKRWKDRNLIFLDDLLLNVTELDNISIDLNHIMYDDWAIFMCSDAAKIFCRDYKSGVKRMWDGEDLKSNMTWIAGLAEHPFTVFSTRQTFGTTVFPVRTNTVMPNIEKM